MSSSNNETAAKSVLETQQQSKSVSENEESDSVQTDQSSSAVSEHATRKEQKSTQSNAAKTTTTTHTKNATNSTSPPKPAATQFSVQHSDVDGLRMKFSAIRPNVNLSNTKNTTSNHLSKKEEKLYNKSNSISNNQTQSKQQRKMSLTTETTTTGAEATAAKDATKVTAPVAAALCQSDATESGCSEATTTTVAASNGKATKKIKIKRKKITSKLINASTKLQHKQQKQTEKKQNEFSSDSEDDIPLKLHQQRAPRLLLTAINSSAPTSVLTATPAAPGSDNIGLSSSDNELPNLVKAAIKCVESDTEDTTVEGSFRKAAKAKHLPQYQSTLLQDFMEKTQMLGQNATASTTCLSISVSPDSNSLKAAASSQSESISSSTSRKRRGRPKKMHNSTLAAINNSKGNNINKTAVNESPDSGVISTTSTTQSTTPSPKMQVAAASTSALTINATTALSTSRRSQQQQQQQLKQDTFASTTTDNGTTTTSGKPKIAIAYVDKRLYACTERRLYPAPRNKRRQSQAADLSNNQHQKKSGAKEELDPVWREIDVNKKFHLRSVSGYKSDGGGTTICSKILAAKSGYVSDYGSVHPRNHHSHNSGYKSDASCKSRYSTKSCMSRRSRAKSCGYRSDCKESSATHKSSKFRRKRRASMLLKANSKPLSSLELDILQLAGLSLGQSSEESNEYTCKPSLKSVPTTSASKKNCEINRFITTGHYFDSGGGNTSEVNGALSSAASTPNTFKALKDASQVTFVSKMLMQRKSTLASADLSQAQARKIKSRRSSAASYCSSYYSGTSRVRRRHRRKSVCLPRSSSKSLNIDSKLLTEIEIITTTFANRCRIQEDRLAASSGKEKLLAEANKLQQTLSAATTSASTTSAASNANLNTLTGSSITKMRDKRTLKKRKMSEPLVDFAMLSASAAAGGNLTPNNNSSSGKRRHKKANTNSSPDDHKLPLKKRHYLLTPGEKSSEAVAFSATSKLNAEAWAAAAATAKSTASTKSQAQFNARTASATATQITPTGVTSTTAASSAGGKSGLTPKKRHLLQNVSEDSASSSSPLRIAVDNNSISGGKLLDISPSSLCSLKMQKRNRSENKMNANGIDTAKYKPQVQSFGSPSSSSCPPPGVFEPSVELEIQIPPISKLNEAATIITKAEVDSPLLTLDINASTMTTKSEQGTRVVESLLHKTGGNLLLKRKRKKINRTGFPTVRRKKRKNTVDSHTAEIIPEPIDAATIASPKPKDKPVTECERVPQVGETSETFVARANQRTPRLSVVALERLQGSPRPTTPAVLNKAKQASGKRVKSSEDNKQPDSKRTKLIRTESAAEEQPKARVRKSKTTIERIVNDKPKVSKIITPTVPATSKKGRRSKNTTSNLSDISNVTNKLKNATNATDSDKLNKITPKVAATTSVSTKKLGGKIKLPAGVDPNTNFSCKIRLKRRNTLHPLSIAKGSSLPTTENAKELPSTPEAIDAEAAAKDIDALELEHDVLPLSEAQSLDTTGYTTCSDTSDEKSSNASSSMRKFMRTKKNYLSAGLFSDYFKRMDMAPPVKIQKKSLNKSSNAVEKQSTTSMPESVAPAGSLLPPPPYCEPYFRRTVVDFELPYDVWWAFTNAKLPVRHSVPSWNYRKIRTNVYHESVRPNMAGYEHPICNCKPDAGCGDNCLNRMVYTECSSTNCPAGDKCRNQKIYRHEVAPGVSRFMTEDKGWGVRTKLPIAKGTYILEYTGEVVTEREFKDRMGTIYLNDTHHYCLHLDGGLVIDGQRMGTDCRFVNHSCEPNCEMQKWSVNGLSRMVLFAKRNIKEGEELTYDYNFSLFNPSEGQPCRCNTPQCRGVIGGKTQRVKPLPLENKNTELQSKDGRKGRQRKHKARKNAQQRQQTKDIAYARVQQLTEKEKKMVKQFNIFLVRNFEKIRRAKAKRNERKAANQPNPKSPTPNSTTPVATAATITKRRPSTPASAVASQISALCTPRNVKTRGFTLAGQDPEVEKMAKMAVILRDICAALEELKATEDASVTIVALTLSNSTAAGNKKKKAMKTAHRGMAFKTVQNNIEQGHYKLPSEFDADMQQLFTEARLLHAENKEKLSDLETLITAYNTQKQNNYAPLLEIIVDEQLLCDFGENQAAITNTVDAAAQSHEIDISNHINAAVACNEDVIRCICGLYKDEGLMIQCSNCMVWQHTECTKADINAENYQCERCEPRTVDREIALDEYTEEGHRYYLSLMRGKLQVRQGDAVYVLRDIPMKDAVGKAIPTKKHTYETIGKIDYQECDIFRVEHLWKNEAGQRFIFGHHFLRPHETFHEPSRRFYPNEVVRVSLYEVVPIELVIGRCWVLDRTTFCKGRPIECHDDEHCYICELRVDKTARFFSKAKANYPTCTKNYAFRKFPEKLKISKTYAPHDIDPALLKSRKQKSDAETIDTPTPNATTQKQSTGAQRKRASLATPTLSAAANPTTLAAVAAAPALQAQKQKYKRTRLENVLNTMKLKVLDAYTAQEAPIDLSYLLSGRGARQRKPHN